MIDALSQGPRGLVPPDETPKPETGLPARAPVCASLFTQVQRHLSATRGEELLLCNTMEPTIDLNLHPAQSQAQTLLVCNQIITETAEQLNAFAATCEEKLIAMHYKMQRLETGVRLLESKLGSLPGGGNTSNARYTVIYCHNNLRPALSSKLYDLRRQAVSEIESIGHQVINVVRAHFG